MAMGGYVGIDKECRKLVEELARGDCQCVFAECLSCRARLVLGRRLPDSSAARRDGAPPTGAVTGTLTAAPTEKVVPERTVKQGLVALRQSLDADEARRGRRAITIRAMLRDAEKGVRTFRVSSFTGSGVYTVKRRQTGRRLINYTCSCPDFQRRGRRCKHGQLVADFIKLAGGIELVPPGTEVTA